MLAVMKQKLRQIAADAGCAGFGVTSAEEFGGVAAALHERNESGFSGRRRFTFKDPDLAADVRRSFPWAMSLVVLSWSYAPEAGSPGPALPGTGRVARFATANHYQGLRRAADSISQWLREQGYHAEVLIDDDRLVDRAAAVRAGLVWWGKSTMTLDPKHGPWLLLGSIVTSARLDVDRPMRRDCGSCDACIPACPTNAIVAPGVLDASRCLAHWLQTAGVFPRDLRAALADRVYGCDDCLEACPPGSKRIANAPEGRGRIDLFELLASDDESLLAAYGHFFLPRRRPRILRRNAILALGNAYAADQTADSVSAVSVLIEYLNGPDETLRLHAAWALGRIGGPAPRAALQARLETERVPVVRDEIDHALKQKSA